MGWVLLQQTQKGLLDHRVDAVLVEVNTAVAEANRQLDGALTSSDPNEQQTALGNLLVKRGGSRGFQVVLIGPVGAVPTDRRGCADPDPRPGHVQRSRDPRAALRRGGHHRLDLHQHPRRRASRRCRASSSAPSCSSRRTAASTRSYFLFPLDEEQETLALVTRAMVTAAALLLLLVAGLTWLVTRQVVTPVRMARRVAERLAAGQLQERLQVKGEDDLARLATSFNQMASNLQRQIRQLEELSRVQQQFVSDVSHELRTPLTTVRMAGDVLHDARRSFDPATSRAAELLQNELDRFETLLVDLLEISRFDAGAAVLDLDEVNLVDVAHRVVDQTRALADQRHTRVVVDAPDHACLAEADVRRVERIVRNLVTNAIDHAETHDVVVHVARRRPGGGDRGPRLRRRPAPG